MKHGTARKGKHVSNAQTSTVAEARDLFGGKGLFRRWVHYSEGDSVSPFTIVVETEMEPGSHAGLHTQNDQHEMLYVLAGAGKLSIDGETFDVKAGDALMAPAGSSFALSNPGSQPLRYLAVKCRTRE
jgi:mannose-6-phosphate isomerase-like protein (cupin superfamily)